jgi:hypothetical protein
MARVRNVWGVVLAVVVAGAAGLATLSSDAIADQCDGKAIPCPLQVWMRANAGTPMGTGDLATLAKTMDKARKYGGPDMADWDKIAKKTADDAAANKPDDVKADCKVCHDLYKDNYKKDPVLRNKEIK